MNSKSLRTFLALALLLASALPAMAAPPTATSFSTTVSTVGATMIQLQGADADGTALVFAIGASPSHGALSALNTATGSVVYTPTAGYVGADSFTFTVTSGGDTTAAATVSLTVTNAKTTVTGNLLNPDGSARAGKITFMLTQPVTGPDGLISATASTSAVLGSGGQFSVHLYPSRSLSPQAYYQVWFTPTNGLKNEVIGVYDIPASTTSIPLSGYKVTDTNLAARYVFASLAQVDALARGVANATLAQLTGLSLAANSLAKWDGSLLVNSIVSDNGSTATVTGNLNVTGDITGDGSGLTGITGATGGVNNTGSTTIGADSDNNGTGVVSLQIGGTERAQLNSAGLAGSAVTQLTGRYDVRQYGATGNGTTDDSAAILAAINAAAAVSPSTTPSTVYFPPGVYKVGTPIVKSMTGLQSHLVFEGAGSASQLLLAVTSAQTAISIQNAYHVTFRKLVFKGVPGATVGRGLSFSATLLAVIEFCDFYGVSSNGFAWGGPVYQTGSRLAIRNTGFYGCSGDSLNNTGNVTAQSWRDVHLDTVQFIDFGTINGTLYSTSSSPDGWVRLGNAIALSNSYSGSHATFRNIVSDEAGATTLKAYTDDGSQIQSVIVEGWRANNGVLNGFWFNGVRRAVLRNSQMAYSPSVVTDGFSAVVASNVETLEIKDSQFLFNSNAITLGAGVGFTKIENSTYRHLNNPNNGRVEETVGGLTKVRHFGTAETGPTQSAPGAGTVYLDEATGRLKRSLNGEAAQFLSFGSAPTGVADAFTSTSMDAAKWTLTSGGSNVATAQSGGTLNFTPTANASYDETDYYQSVSIFDFTKNGRLTGYAAGLVAAGGTPVYEQFISIVDTGGGGAYAMSFTNSGFIPCDGAIAYPGEPYWEIKWDAATSQIKCSTSLDGASWTQRAAFTPVFTPSSIRVRVGLRVANPGAVTSTAKFDDIRLTQSFAPIFDDDGKALKATNDVNITTTGKGVVQKSPNGTCWRMKVDNAGALSTEVVTCP